MARSRVHLVRSTSQAWRDLPDPCVGVELGRPSFVSSDPMRPFFTSGLEVDVGDSPTIRNQVGPYISPFGVALFVATHGHWPWDPGFLTPTTPLSHKLILKLKKISQ